MILHSGNNSLSSGILYLFPNKNVPIKSTIKTNHKKIQIDLACNGEIFDYLFLQKKDIEDELGDLLFSVVNTARFCNCEAETALDKATKKFMKRFTVVEALANEKGIDMKTASIEVLDELWDEAKKKSI